MAEYDFLIVGAGLYGAVFAHEATKAGKRCLVLERRSHIAGNAYTECVEGIDVHVYGAHIFHTDNVETWKYVNQFSEFNNFINSPIACYKGKIFNLPFNMNTFYQMWGVVRPEEAKRIIEKQRTEAGISSISNLEEQAISMVGRDIYEKMIKHYTAKQWGRPCNELPPFIIKRLPVRFTYNNNYFDTKYQGIPILGYTELVKHLLEGIELLLDVDFLNDREGYSKLADRVVYTGAIDEYYDYCYGPLKYRSLKFETKILDTENFQGNAVINYTDGDIPYTRVIEHKHFNFGNQPKTVVTWEYSTEWKKGDEPYYPINDEVNNNLYSMYKQLSEESNVIFGGRLGEYKYYDMDAVVEAAQNKVKEIITYA